MKETKEMIEAQLHGLDQEIQDNLRQIFDLSHYTKSLLQRKQSLGIQLAMVDDIGITSQLNSTLESLSFHLTNPEVSIAPEDNYPDINTKSTTPAKAWDEDDEDDYPSKKETLKKKGKY